MDFIVREVGIDELKSGMIPAEIKEEYHMRREQLARDYVSLLEGRSVDRTILDRHFDDTMRLLEKCGNVFQLIETFRNIDKSVYTKGYNLALMAYKIGVWYKLSADELRELFIASLLADIGEIKCEEVSGSEDEEHIVISYKAVRDYKFIPEIVKNSILLHHEKKDGSGYPFGKKGDEIPLYSRIIAVADAYNTLTLIFTPLDAVIEMKLECIGKLDEKIVLLLYNSISYSVVGQIVKLNNGEVGKIIFVDEKNMLRPIVKTISGKFLNLADSQNNSIVISEFLV